MDGMPKIRVITIVWDLEADSIDIDYDTSEISVYEAWGMLSHAIEIQKNHCLLDEDEEEDE